MEHIVKSLKPAALVVVAAVVFMFGTAFLIAADATMTPSSLGASSDLAQAARWLQFLAAVAALAAVCTAGWELVLRSEWTGGLEIAAAALGTLMIMIDLLASAASNGSSAAAAVIGAVGIGVWALLVLSRAARTSLAEQASRTAGPRRADLAGHIVPGRGDRGWHRPRHSHGGREARCLPGYEMTAQTTLP